VIEERIRVQTSRATERSRARDSVARAKIELARRKDPDDRILEDQTKHRRADAALKRAAGIRSDAQTIKNKVEAVRSKIIGKEFNDRLNRLWRDLFVRLAPNEPYVPAFRIPTDSTHRLQPKLITTHRSGQAGGTPGAMLSAGNLNTAALTLFIALHLTVTAQSILTRIFRPTRTKASLPRLSPGWASRRRRDGRVGANWRTGRSFGCSRNGRWPTFRSTPIFRWAGRPVPPGVPLSNIS
jgi:hypothetical protein